MAPADILAVVEDQFYDVRKRWKVNERKSQSSDAP
jgi:hypothetical protein